MKIKKKNNTKLLVIPTICDQYGKIQFFFCSAPLLVHCDALQRERARGSKRMKKKKKDWSWMKKKHKPVCYLLFSMHFAELQCWNENGNARRLRYQFVVLFISIYICGDFFCCCCCSILFLLLLLLFCTF